VERERIYGFLAGVFGTAPTAESARAVSEMALALRIPCPDGQALDQLEREFMDLFVVPNPRYVSPYESAYRDRWLLPTGLGKDATEQVVGRLLMGESTLAVRQCFLDAGTLPLQDLPDHISNELRLMAHLWASEESESGSLGSRRELRAKVRDEHLLQWIGQLRQKVSENESLGYFSAALDLAEVILKNDEQEDAA
jgi:TorA maturation chaperone TorD